MKRLRNLSTCIVCTIRDENDKKRELTLLTKSLSKVNRILKERFLDGYKILKLELDYTRTVVVKQKGIKAYQCFSTILFEDSLTLVFGMADSISSFEKMCAEIAPEASIGRIMLDEFALDTNYYVTEVNIG